MQQRLIVRCVAAVLALLLCLSALSVAVSAAEGDKDATVISYTISKNSSGNTGHINKGDTVTLSVLLQLWDALDPDETSYKVSYGGGNFVGGSTDAEAVSNQSGSNTVVRANFYGITYIGEGTALDIRLGAGSGAETTIYNASVNISEAENLTNGALLVTRGDLSSIWPGERKNVTLNFENLSGQTLSGAIASISTSSGLILTSNSSSFKLEDIPGKDSKSLTVPIRALDELSSQNQYLIVTVKDATGKELCSEQLSIPASVPHRVSDGAPLILVERNRRDKPIVAGEEFSVLLTFNNEGDVDIMDPVASFTVSEALMILNDTSTVLLDDIDAGDSDSFRLKLKARESIGSESQSISVTLKYNYEDGDSIAQGSTSDTVNLQATTTGDTVDGDKVAAPVPNVVISNFTYGEGASVAAGEKFNLGITFDNTGRLPIENIVVTVEGGENFTVDGATNTYFYNNLAAQGKQTLEVPFQALASAKSGAQNVGVSFKYEYVDGKVRSSANANINVSVPVSQPDRFQITEPKLPEYAMMGEELVITMDYVNKGKADTSNLEAVIESDKVDSPAMSQYLGNVPAGSSGMVGFVMTPMEVGEIDVLLRITYEDPDQQVKTLEWPITLSVQEPFYEDPGMMDPTFPMEPEEPQSSFSWWWLLPIALVVAVVIFLLLRRRKKKKAAAAALEDWDWEEEDSALPESTDEQHHTEV